MSLFESTLALLAIAVVLLQLARRLRVPYPALLALAGGCVAALPFAPQIHIEPQLALALFVAPAVMDAAFDIPPRGTAAQLAAIGVTGDPAGTVDLGDGGSSGNSNRPSARGRGARARRHRRTARCGSGFGDAA